MGASQSSSNRVSGSGRRPLADVILELEKRHGWIVTYEDPPYESPDDVEEVTVAGGDRKVIAPRERFFAFDYRDPDTTTPRDPLSPMLAAYGAANNDAFRLVQQGSMYPGAEPLTG